MPIQLRLMPQFRPKALDCRSVDEMRGMPPKALIGASVPALPDGAELSIPTEMRIGVFPVPLPFPLPLPGPAPLGPLAPLGPPGPLLPGPPCPGPPVPGRAAMGGGGQVWQVLVLLGSLRLASGEGGLCAPTPPLPKTIRSSSRSTATKLRRTSRRSDPPYTIARVLFTAPVRRARSLCARSDMTP